MKTALVGTLSVLIAVGLLPVVIAGGEPPTSTPRCGQTAGPMATILETIRALESSGDYTAQAPGSSASGAYQFIDTTWDGYGGYTRAADAPPSTQDAKATQHVDEILGSHGGDVTAVPVVWFIGHLPPPNSAEWDTVPHPEAGNVLTPRQYQTKWMNLYDQRLNPANTGLTAASSPAAIQPGGCTGGSVEPLPGGWSLPGPRHLIEADPTVLETAHHDYPAWDWAIPENTPIYAIRGGSVTAVHTWAQNWWDADCDSRDGAGCNTCGVGLTITNDDGTQWTYCHGNQLTTTSGDIVEAGQQIMWSGNTGRSTGPHLHLDLRVDGALYCPQSLLRTLYVDVPAAERISTPVRDCERS